MGFSASWVKPYRLTLKPFGTKIACRFPSQVAARWSLACLLLKSRFAGTGYQFASPWLLDVTGHGRWMYIEGEKQKHQFVTMYFLESHLQFWTGQAALIQKMIKTVPLTQMSVYVFQILMFSLRCLVHPIQIQFVLYLYIKMIYVCMIL